ncbi:MAG: hypothetical protein QM704_02305 [Anaeromyxobacteraceae bacterium]
MHPALAPLVLVALAGQASAPAAAPAVEPSPPGPAPAPTAETAPWSLDLTFHDVGLGIGNTRHVDGLRLNFRDAAPYVVHGVSATVWTPYPGHDEHADEGGAVTGLVLGLPLGGAGTVRGLGVGLLGVGTAGDFDGLGLGLLGVGAGGRLNGIFVSGVGVGAGGGATGAVLGLVGAGTGGDVNGILAGGVGAGTGGDVNGLLLGGLGAGAGGSLRGIGVALLGLGAGGGLDGIAVAGLGLGAPRIRGVAAALAVGGVDLTGIFLAPAYLHVEPQGRMTGVSVSAFNRILGEQRGVAIGILNYAAHLEGVQLGLLNYAGNNPPGLRWLPVANAHL